jgi:MoaA/NifB/PqqE/SkfB family radical SAM enzyme
MEKFICKNPWTHFEVNNPNGDVTMCCDNNTILGNVNDETIEEIWNGEKFQDIRRVMRDKGAHSICPHTCPVMHGGKKYQELTWYKELSNGGVALKNAELNELEQQEGRLTLNSLPRWMRFTYSYHCNLDCYHCYQRDDAVTNTKLPDKFINEIRKHSKIYQVLFPFGGEPFLFKPVNHLVAELDTDPGCRFFFITNGTLLTEPIMINLERRRLGLMAVSLDAASAETFDRLRVRGRSASWDTVMENLESLSELKEKKGFHMTVSMTVNSVNCHEISSFIELAHRFDAEPVLLLVSNPKQTADFQREFLLFRKDQFVSMYAQIEDGLQLVRSRNQREAELSLLQLRAQLRRHRIVSNGLFIFRAKLFLKILTNYFPESIRRKLRVASIHFRSE